MVVVLGGVEARPSEPARGTQVRSGRVLVVDDSEMNRAVAREMLTELGIDVVEVANGADAIARVERERFDLILMDCQMPIMDGYEATARIRHIEGGARRTPIVALTAHATSTAREVSLAAGMDDYLVKPVTIDALSLVLDRWVEHSDATMPRLPVEPGDAELEVGTPLVDSRATRKPRFIQLFLDLAPADLARIRAASDATALARSAHKLKGDAGLLGLPTLVRTCEQLEKLGRDGDLVAAASLIDRLTGEFAATEQALRAELGASGPAQGDVEARPKP
jgi:two-component system, sensor histidine kinase and response regulator